MRGAIARSSGWDGENWQVRTEIKPEQVCIDQRGTDLAELFWYWQERSMLENGVPSIESFRFPGSDLIWVELESDDPMRFIIRNHPVNATIGNWSNTRLEEHPIAMHAQSCAFEYLDCKERKKPTFIQVDQRILGIHRIYTKLMVPIADKNGAIVRAYYAVRLLRFPVIFGGAS